MSDLFNFMYNNNKLCNRKYGRIILNLHNFPSDVEYYDDIKHGAYIIWNTMKQPTKKSYSTTYHMGKIHGVETFWFINGKKDTEAVYINGNKIGKDKYWNYNGELIKLDNYSL